MSTLEISAEASSGVELWSGGEGRPLLYLHGYERHPGGAEFLTRLAGSHRVLAPEHPGYGSSPGLEGVHEVVDVVLFYRRLIESWGVDELDVVGHSLGGMFAAEFAAICPHLVRRLVLVNAFGLWLDDELALDPFGNPDDVRAAKWHGDPPEREPTNYVADPQDPQGATIFQVRNLATATKFMWPIADRGLRRRLRYIEAPTLVVHGDSDGLLPVAYGEELVRLVPDARLALIAGAGHYPMVERQDEFVSTVDEFLSS